MHEIFITIGEKEMHEKKNSFHYLPTFKILGNYGASKDVFESSVIEEKWSSSEKGTK